MHTEVVQTEQLKQINQNLSILLQELTERTTLDFQQGSSLYHELINEKGEVINISVTFPPLESRHIPKSALQKNPLFNMSSKVYIVISKGQESLSEKQNRPLPDHISAFYPNHGDVRFTFCRTSGLSINPEPFNWYDIAEPTSEENAKMTNILDSLLSEFAQTLVKIPS